MSGPEPRQNYGPAPQGPAPRYNYSTGPAHGSNYGTHEHVDYHHLRQTKLFLGGLPTTGIDQHTIRAECACAARAPRTPRDRALRLSAQL